MALSTSDVQTMYSLLLNSLSPDESLRKPAEAALSQSESRSGFCSCLLEIIAARDLSCREDVRLLASVYFKNSINRYWRQRRDSPGISNEEKIHLRKKLLLHIREENTQIALQLAVLISKIARIDYPKEWPELFSLLANQLQTADILASHRVFMVLFRTLKELSTKRLTADQRNFSEITGHLFDYTWNFWKSDLQTILQSFSSLSQCIDLNSFMGQSSDLLFICERWLLCLKIVRQLIISGCSSDTTSAQVIIQIGLPGGLAGQGSLSSTLACYSIIPLIFCKRIFTFSGLLLARCLIANQDSSFQEKQVKLCDFTKRACTKLMKVIVSLQGKHSYSFGHQSVLPPVMDFCLNMMTNPEQAVTPFEQLLIQCMVLVKSILECKEYKRSLTGRVISETGQSLSLEQRKKNFSAAVSNMLKAILPSDRAILLCNILIKRYFIYTAKDLDEWHQNPESFHHEKDMVQWTEKQRPCAEALFIVLFETHRQLLAPVVVSILREAMGGSPPLETQIIPGMLLKDAAYTAAGHVYYELSNYFNFDEWFHGSLSIELSNDHPNMHIIHRKIALILGQWVSEIKGDTRKLVYHALVRLLQSEDIAVRLAACWSLCYLVQDTNFSERDILELLPTCLTLCFKLMEDVQEFDSKVQVLNFISVLLEHAGEKVLPFASQLSSFFQKIWEESTGESLLKIQLLGALRNFVCSLGCQSPICYGMLLPILLSGINVDSPDALNLLEDSVLLWEATLSNAPSILPQLLDFFPYLVGIMERSFDHLQVAVTIIEDYIVFGGAEFLKRHAPSLAKLLDVIIGNVNDKGLLSTLPIVDILIQCFPLEAPSLIPGVIQKLIFICLCGDDEHNPSRTTVRATSGAILARLLVMNTKYLAQLASEPSLSVALQQAGLSINQNILLCLVDMWIDKIDNATVVQRKAYALALSIILTLGVPEVLDKLDEILSICTSIIMGGNEELSEEDSSGDITSSPWPNDENHGYGSVSSKELRRRQIKDSDPIKQLSLEGMLRENLKTCASLHGEASFNAAISRIHPSAFAQLQQALKMV